MGSLPDAPKPFLPPIGRKGSIREDKPKPGIVFSDEDDPEMKEDSKRPASEGSIAKYEASEETVQPTVAMQPISMRRAKVWTTEVENAFRFQLAGYRGKEEYECSYGIAEVWPGSGFVKCLQAKRTGYNLSHAHYFFTPV